MTPTQIRARLHTLGATDYEASLLAEIMHLNGWDRQPAHKTTKAQREALLAWLAEFREERAAIAATTRNIREQRRAAGYRVSNCKHAETICLREDLICAHCGETVSTFAEGRGALDAPPHACPDLP